MKPDFHSAYVARQVGSVDSLEIQQTSALDAWENEGGSFEIITATAETCVRETTSQAGALSPREPLASGDTIRMLPMGHPVRGGTCCEREVKYTSSHFFHRLSQDFRNRDFQDAVKRIPSTACLLSS